MNTRTSSPILSNRSVLRNTNGSDLSAHRASPRRQSYLHERTHSDPNLEGAALSRAARQLASASDVGPYERADPRVSVQDAVISRLGRFGVGRGIGGRSSRQLPDSAVPTRKPTGWRLRYATWHCAEDRGSRYRFRSSRTHPTETVNDRIAKKLPAHHVLRSKNLGACVRQEILRGFRCLVTSSVGRCFLSS